MVIVNNNDSTCYTHSNIDIAFDQTNLHSHAHSLELLPLQYMLGNSSLICNIPKAHYALCLRRFMLQENNQNNHIPITMYSKKVTNEFK